MEAISAMIPELSVGGVSLLVVIGVVVAGIKMAGLPTRWLPLASMILGAIAGYVAYATDGITFIQGIVGGLVVGASVSGIYDLGSKTILNK